jgi:hypothetical protein
VSLIELTSRWDIDWSFLPREASPFVGWQNIELGRSYKLSALGETAAKKELGRGEFNLALMGSESTAETPRKEALNREVLGRLLDGIERRR